MAIEIRKATMTDMENVSHVYDRVNDYLETNENYPGWKKGVYPTVKDAKQGIKEEALFIATQNDKIAGTFILRHKPEEAYNQVTWKKQLNYNEVFVIYTFMVEPDFLGQGIGNAMLDFITKYSKKAGMKSIRLDVVDTNIPAIQLYEKNEFEYINTVDLGYGEYGLDWFRLYEKLI